jgi:hypothetical protein
LTGRRVAKSHWVHLTLKLFKKKTRMMATETRGPQEMISRIVGIAKKIARGGSLAKSHKTKEKSILQGLSLKPIQE